MCSICPIFDATRDGNPRSVVVEYQAYRRGFLRSRQVGQVEQVGRQGQFPGAPRAQEETPGPVPGLAIPRPKVALGLEGPAAPGHRPLDRDGYQGRGILLQGIAPQHHEVGEFARFDRSFQMLLERSVRAV